MSGLADLQSDFQQGVLVGDARALEHIVGDNIAPANQRFDVYFQAYRLRLREVLQKDFPGLYAMLGGSAFAQLVDAYMAEHPSHYPSVRWVGEHLQSFLTKQSPWKDRGELSEMAAFEWAWGLVFDGPDAPVERADVLTGLQPESWAGLRVRLLPRHQLLHLHWNVPAVFGAVSHEEPLPDVVRGETEQHWLLWRRDLDVHWRSASADEAWALQCAADGGDFAALCEGLCQWHVAADVPLRAASLLKTWFADGLICAAESG